MNTTIEAVLIETCDAQNMDLQMCITLNPQVAFIKEAMQKYAELYHTRKCEEAGNELPTKEVIVRCECPDLETEREGWKRGALWMRAVILKLLATKQFQLEAKDKGIEELQKELDLKTFQQEGYEKTIQEVKSEIERIPYLESTIEANNQRIEELKSQLK